MLSRLVLTSSTLLLIKSDAATKKASRNFLYSKLLSVSLVYRPHWNMQIQVSQGSSLCNVVLNYEFRETSKEHASPYVASQNPNCTHAHTHTLYSSVELTMRIRTTSSAVSGTVQHLMLSRGKLFGKRT